MTLSLAAAIYPVQKSQVAASARATYSELVLDPKVDPFWTTPSELKVSSFLVDTNPPPLQVNRWIKANCRAFDPFLRDATVNGWFRVSSVGSGHLLLMLCSTPTSTCWAQQCRSFFVTRLTEVFEVHHCCSALMRKRPVRQAKTGISSP